MIQIDDIILSRDILEVNFCCDLTRCKGICCVEGSAGAPLEIEELDILEAEYNNYKPYMTPEGIASVERNGFMVIDEDGDYTTPLVNGAECAYSVIENGITFCAIEKAYKNGKTSFLKPISCHLYPIRLTTFGDGSTGMNYHRWGVCSDALTKGGELEIPMYKMLKEPLIRRFGKDFFAELEEAAALLKKEKEGRGK